MGFSTIFIRRPIATSLLMIGLMLLGILGYQRLPVAALPEIEAPSLVVTTQYPGASAQTMASLVTTPLERQLGQISGLDMMTSDSSAGLSSIVLQFSMERDLDTAAQDVQAAIRQATLPSSLPYQPVYNRVNPADAPILTLKLASDTRPLREVNDLADSILAQRLSEWCGHGPSLEEDLALAQGVLMLAMGPRVLRTETAGLSALAALNAVWGEM